MRRQPAADPMAVWSFVKAGEELAAGDPSVTDQQRAAAGCEAVAERSRPLPEPSRRHAVQRYAAGGLPDGEEVLRLQPRLWPVQGAGDLWEASLRIRRLSKALTTITMVPPPPSPLGAGVLTHHAATA